MKTTLVILVAVFALGGPAKHPGPSDDSPPPVPTPTPHGGRSVGKIPGPPAPPGPSPIPNLPSKTPADAANELQGNPAASKMQDNPAGPKAVETPAGAPARQPLAVPNRPQRVSPKPKQRP